MSDNVSRKILLAIAVMVVIVLTWFRLAVLINGIETDSGTVINAEVDGDHWFVLEGNSEMTALASSCEFFSFKQGNDFLPSEPIEPPFDWPCPDYYFLSEKLAWGEGVITAEEVVNVRISSEDTILMRYGIPHQNVDSDLFWMSLILLLLWIGTTMLIFM